MPAPIRDTALFLDVHMNQIARGWALVTDHLCPADRQTGGLVQIRKPWHPIPLEHAFNR